MNKLSLNSVQDITSWFSKMHSFNNSMFIHCTWKLYICCLGICGRIVNVIQRPGRKLSCAGICSYFPRPTPQECNKNAGNAVLNKRVHVQHVKWFHILLINTRIIVSREVSMRTCGVKTLKTKETKRLLLIIFGMLNVEMFRTTQRFCCLKITANSLKSVVKIDFFDMKRK